MILSAFKPFKLIEKDKNKFYYCFLKNLGYNALLMIKLKKKDDKFF